jgi:SpoVK/Ycf46/Vps4 family AAA+-type ATPase
VLIVHDWHVLVNNPGQWRTLIDTLPALRDPANSKQGDPASLVVFVGPSFDLTTANPLKGGIPILQFAAPKRDALLKIAAALCPTNGLTDGVADSLCGLTADAAEQAAAECLAANKKWDVEHLRQSRRKILEDAGLQMVDPVPWEALRGMSGFKDAIETRVLPFIRDPQLGVRCILTTGLPGIGKSFSAAALAGRIGCECVELNLEKIKSSGGGIVGQAGAAFERTLSALDVMGTESPIVVLLDELEKVASEGLDGGTSSGLHSELLKWLQRIKDEKKSSRILVIGTVNEAGKLSAPLENRFQLKFFYNNLTWEERRAVAEYHYNRLGCQNVAEASKWTADATEGFTSRELAETVCPDVAALTARNPTDATIQEVVAGIIPTSKIKAEEFESMRKAAAGYRRANDPVEEVRSVGGRRVSGITAAE